ncbi:MAG: aspartate carbamoyltransferase, partial [Ruminococcus sp.]|nr:aspartate carbamoyltransferase [Ruminococcus sp.]
MLNKNLIDLEALSVTQIDKLIRKARKIMQSPADYRHACDGKILATLFYEPSTRTQMSFQTAMLKLGGRTIGFDNPMNSSVAKGESLKDTVSVISGYADIIAMRHPIEGTAMAASLYSQVPLINCGDGGHLHPTQTLTDIVTLSCEKGRLDHMKIGVCGDLLNGRTVHSLIKTLAKYEGNSFVLISTKELGVPLYIIDILEKNGCPYEISHNLAEAITDLDVLYMTRIQRERFKSEAEYEAQKYVFVLDREKLGRAREDMIILHPLPRVNEIT